MTRARLAPPPREELATRYQTMSMSMLARHYGVSTHIIDAWLWTAQIPRRKRGERIVTADNPQSPAP